MSWQARLEGEAIDVEAEKVMLDMLKDFVEAHIATITYHVVRTEFWGEGDVIAVAAGEGVRSPGQAAAWAEANPPPDTEPPPDTDGNGDQGGNGGDQGKQTSARSRRTTGLH